MSKNHLYFRLKGLKDLTHCYSSSGTQPRIEVMPSTIFFFLILNVIRTQLELKEKQVISSAEFYQMKVSNLKKYIFVGKDSAHLKF